MRPFAIVGLAVIVATATGVGGYLAGARAAPRVAPVATLFAESPAAGAPVRGVSADVQALKNQLAICMAYQRAPEGERPPGHDPTTDALAGCRSQLELERADRPTLPSCYAFADAAPTYDRELGAPGDTSADMTERAAHLTVDDCAPLLVVSKRAEYNRTTCLKGETPQGWKERYASPIDDRPLVKACMGSFPIVDLNNAWFRYNEQQIRERGGVIRRSVRMAPDGGFLAGPVDPEPGSP